MLKDIFLAYANNSLKDKPKILYEIFENFTKETNIEFAFKDNHGTHFIHAIIKHFIDILRCNDYQTAKSLFSGDESSPGYLYFQISLQAVFGYGDGYCEDENGCYYSTERRFVLGNDRFSGFERIKCFECDQLFFTYMLDCITKGKEYSDIGTHSFEIFIANSNRHLKKIVAVVSAHDGSSFKKTLKEKVVFVPLLRTGDNNKVSFRSVFMEGIIAYSLTRYLVAKGRRLLKHCPVCHDYFIAERLNQIYCSKGCKWAKNWPPEKWNKYMKDRRDKERVERQQIQKTEREKEIQKRMRELDLTRKEAIEQIDFDNL